VQGVPEAKPKSEWNHADLAAHLKTKGVVVRVGSGGIANVIVPGSLASEFIDDANGEHVMCFLTQTDRQAHEAAASIGAGATPWGKFVISDRHRENAGLYNRILAALR
jgi:hypothetical protein